MTKLNTPFLAAALMALFFSAASAADWHDAMNSGEKISLPAVPAATPVNLADKGPGRVLATSYSITSGQVLEISPNLFVVQGEVFSYYSAKIDKKKVSGPLWFKKSDVRFENLRVFSGGQAIADCRPDGHVMPGFKCDMRPGVGIAVKQLPDGVKTFVLVKN